MADPVTLSLVGASTAIGIMGARAEGKTAEQVAERKAKASMATGSRKGYAAGKAGKALESDVRAHRAAGGGGFDEGAIERLGKVKAKTEYNVLSALYEGEAGADLARYEGEIKKKAAKRKMLTTALSGGSKMYGAYKAPAGDQNWDAYMESDNW